jgi:ribosomal protein S18 acetylase RimI-like enzyme
VATDVRLSLPGRNVIEYRDRLDDISPDHLRGFWDGWPAAPSSAAHLRLLAGSEAVVLAVDPASAGRVVGFVTAVGDGVLASYIPFLEVLPAYRGKGIGSELVRRLLLRLRDRYMVDLVCDEDLVPFYERFGMVRHGAMILRRHDALDGVR